MTVLFGRLVYRLITASLFVMEGHVVLLDPAHSLTAVHQSCPHECK